MKRRALLVTAIVAVLTLVGGGGAIAYWSATTHLETEAATAKIGMTQTVHPDAASTPLNVTYNASNLTAAGAVTVVNTGSRGADYSIALTTQSQTTTGLVGAISVAVAPVSTVGACTPTTTLSAPQTGTLSATAAFAASGRVDAGQTLILCVKTSLSSAGATTYANASAVLGVQTQVQYAPLAAWTLTGTQVSFTQSVGSSLLFFTDSSARYNIYNEGRCVYRQYMADGTYNVARDSNCLADGRDTSWDYQWRIFRLSDGSFNISWANNDSGTPLAPRLTATAPGNTPLRTQPASDSATQRWQINAVSGGTFAIESVAYPGNCLTIGPSLWGGSPYGIILAACTNRAAQQFSFGMIGDPVRTPEVLACSTSNGVSMSFSKNLKYEAETSYRVFLARDTTSTTRVAYPMPNLTGWNPLVQIYDADAALATYVQGGTNRVGNTWVYVEQQIAGGKWNPVASGKIHIAQSGASRSVTCGWR
ncbi:RICIN domain-containing protein [Microbacterium sp. MC2]